MATRIINENDKRTICETAEEILRKNPGRTLFRKIWSYMRKIRPQLAELYKINKKDKGIDKEVLSIMLEWQQTHASKIGYAKIKSCNWFWYGDNTVIPERSSIETNKMNGEEAKFYVPFATWLEKQKECSKAISTGDKVRGKKWSNPDVVGVKSLPKLGGVVGYELISAEIKTSTNTGEIITGFGQACAYKLFSHKSYLVVPSNSNEADLQRIKELCEQHDIGLVVFDKTNPDNPCFELRCSAKLRGRPNPSYVNDSIKQLLKKDGYNIF